MALTLSGTNGVVGAGFTLDPSGASVTAGVGTFGSVASSGAISGTAISGTTGTFSSTGSFSDQLTVASGSDSTRGLRVTGGASGGTEIAQFRTNNGTVRFTVNNNVTLNSGNLVVATSGAGIDFSATGDGSGTSSSELLDDYEEGTWTPVLTFGGASTGITYSNRGGNYTKIGRQVTLNFMIELSSKGSSTGDAVIGGLPYTIADSLAGTVIEANGVSSYWNNIDPDLMFLAFSASTNGNQLTPRFQPETGASDAVDSLDNTNFTNSTNFRGSITFFV